MMQAMNSLYYGDNLKILREHIGSETVDLIYLDPPFNSNASYNVLFQEKSGEQSAAQIPAFEDTWHWTEESEATFHETVMSAPSLTVGLLPRNCRSRGGSPTVREGVPDGHCLQSD